MEGGELKVTVATNVNYEAEVLPSGSGWIRITDVQTKALDDYSMNVMVSASDSYYPKVGQIRLTGANKESIITITQKPLDIRNFTMRLMSIKGDCIEVCHDISHEMEIAYVISDEPLELTADMLFETETIATVGPDDVIKVSETILEDTEYHLYCAARLDDSRKSDVSELVFTDYGEMLTVLETFYDGYSIQVEVPEVTKSRGNAIRYAMANGARYNFYKNKYWDGEEARAVLESVIFNGDVYNRHVKNDTTIIMNNDDIVYDEYNSQITIHEPIAPGEPIVFLVGECRWGSTDELWEQTGLKRDLDNNAYIVPLFDWNQVNPDFDWKNGAEADWIGSGWTGAFQKIEFMSKKPALCDAMVHIDIPEEKITAVDAEIHFDMEEEVTRYLYMILDDEMYNQINECYFEGNEDWYQWFITSYIARVEWGVIPYAESITINAAKSSAEGHLVSETLYHVLCTVMVDEQPRDGANQRFIHKTFTTKEKALSAPVIEVMPVETGDPYEATFKAKLTNTDAGPVKRAYLAYDYVREVEMYMNANGTYGEFAKDGRMLTDAELTALNSDAGLTFTCPTLDGEITRLVVYGCNDEYTYNVIDKDNDGKGWADYEAPMLPPVGKINSPLYTALAGDWTATATIEIMEEGDVESERINYTSKVSISNTAPFLAATLSEDVYALYSGLDRSVVDGYYEELHLYNDRFTEYRLEGQNRLLCCGFMDYDYDVYDSGRLSYMSPYDLFTSEDYISYDVPQIIYDFGPKWFLEIQKDGSVIVPFDSSILPPMSSWNGYPAWVGGYSSSDGSMILEPAGGHKGFPVEISPDYKKITVKPVEIDGVKYYMNAILDKRTNGSGNLEIIASAVISDIVLTRD